MFERVPKLVKTDRMSLAVFPFEPRGYDHHAWCRHG
jgi:hypothetical protein